MAYNVAAPFVSHTQTIQLVRVVDYNENDNHFACKLS